MLTTLLSLLLTGTLANSQPVYRPHVRVREGVSTNWAGYVVATNLNRPESNSIDDVKGQWVVPGVSCTSQNSYSAAWVGIDGYLDNSVEQIGTDQDCSSGKPVYYAWQESYPNPSKFVKLYIHPGDSVSAEVKFIGGNNYQVTLANLTTGQIYSGKERIHGLRRSAEWIMEAPALAGGILPLANFNQTTFTNSTVTVKGKTGSIGDSSWKNIPLQMVTYTGQQKATPSGLSGSGFTVTWKHT